MEEKEYYVFEITTKTGDKAEMAVLDEFSFDGKYYAACGMLVDGTISDEGIYLYRMKETDDDVVFEKITRSFEMNRVFDAYCKMKEEEEEGETEE